MAFQLLDSINLKEAEATLLVLIVNFGRIFLPFRSLYQSFIASSTFRFLLVVFYPFSDSNHISLLNEWFLSLP